MVDSARAAYVEGMHVSVLCGAGLAVLVALMALITLRNVPKEIPEDCAPADTDDRQPALSTS